MEVEPRGLPVALKAWREREREPLLSVRCGAAPDCATEVGAVHDTPNGKVLESWLNTPEASTGWSTDTPASPAQVEAFAADLGLTGVLDDFEPVAGQAPAPPPETQKVVAQIDLVGNQRYWQDPKPWCPTHGNLAIDRHALDRALRRGLTTYEASPA